MTCSHTLNNIQIKPLSDAVVNVVLNVEHDTLPLDNITGHVNRTIEIMEECDTLTDAKEELITGLNIISENIDLIVDNLERGRSWDYGVL